jgi:uncharacterized protein (DUF362 family)
MNLGNIMKDPEELLNDANVAIYQEPGLRYSMEAPYSPHVRYPEYPLKNTGRDANSVYDAVRHTLFLLKLDRDNFGTSHWNPFKEIIGPGNTVVIKPNLVLDRHDEGGDLFSIITHPSIIRAAIDYVYIALGGQGRIVIADAPQMDCDFGALLEKTNLPSIQELYKDELGFGIDVYDLREFWYDVKKAESAKAAYTKYRFKLPGDPQGGVVVPLDNDSLFYGLEAEKFYGADYDRREVIKHHHGEVHDYLVSRTILSADAVILLPKLKVHKKVGVTLNVKGLVGVVVNKNCLVHYRLGMPSENGDQFPEGILDKREQTVVTLQRWASDVLLSRRHPATDAMYDYAAKTASSVFKRLGLKAKRETRLLDAGNWHGNDSAWRMADDLYRLFLYADQEGRLHTKPIRRLFSIIDGVTGGEGDGPLAPAGRECGVLVAGFNPGAVDIVGARLMGFDFNKIKMLSQLAARPELFKVDINSITIESNQDEYKDLLERNSGKRYFNFEPSPGWKGEIEV